ncbi:hypothetical protein [Dyella mobilis]|uniref:Uncharacterized protein n=1 Tax=Dyella mobilis TaxID=1849582 RepID=A0ABS2KHN9_9GAMM|nr:hypothetical protein [Dyella mobilis]MBM7130674.1 hypothetical protein [Dyella mobilis]GLQ97299.1 hypothetical protein GCM10007863_17190 [Dyella mobilis]
MIERCELFGLVFLQGFHVAFLWLHDWVPLGRLNDVAAIRRHDTVDRLIRVTLIQSVPYTLLLILSVIGLPQGPEAMPLMWLWIGYGLLFAGEIRAWWWPYLVRAEPARTERYKGLFGHTHTLLPQRNGIAPNTLHCLLHLATAATLVLLLVLSIKNTVQ